MYLRNIFNMMSYWSHLQELNRLTGLVWAHRRNVVFQNAPGVQLEILGQGSKTQIIKW